MELALIRSLMNKEFYDDHKGARCPDKLFTKDIRKIKSVIDKSIDKYNRSLTPAEVEALFLADNPTMTTAQKQSYASLFAQIKKEKPLGTDVAGEVLSRLFRQVVGEEVANLGFDYVSGTQTSLEPLRSMLDHYTNDFTPNLNIEWDDISIETLLEKADLEARWNFNIPSLSRKIQGVNEGHLIMIGARSNVGKTSFHASLIAGPNGFASQGARCIVLCNEEGYHRVGARYLTAATGLTAYEVKNNMKKARDLYAPVANNLKIKEAGGRDMDWVEAVVKSYNPDIVVLDIADKFATSGGFARPDEALKANAIRSRQLAKEYNCAIFYMSQLSAEAEGKVILNQSMMEGSRTGKAAEADLMIMIAKSPSVEGQEDESPLRHLNIVKNKLNGWHGVINCELDYKIARYGG